MLVGTVDNCHFAEDHKQLKQHYAGEEVMEAVAMSNFVLGTLYEGKTNLAIKWEKDLVKSLHHYQKAAALHHGQSAFNLATLLVSCENEEVRDRKEALKWYTEAANQGIAAAAFMLAQMYQQGEGTQKNPKAALRWAKKAHAGGVQRARDLYLKIEQDNQERRRKIHDIESRLSELEAIREMLDNEDNEEAGITLYKINPGYRFSIRRKPTEDPGCRTGEILEPNTIFKVKKVIKRESSEMVTAQTFLELADGSGWAFTDHPKSNSIKLVSKISTKLSKSKSHHDSMERLLS
mmetsp:Transcript_29934/g.41686  ORF Transcript_29934/g.41686 Transcript_29934/m.41686 type:complete len:292 (-) Transcript_29934:72-947(-)